MFEAFVGPISLRTVSLSPPSWYSNTSLSLLRPPHLRKEALSIESISTRDYAIIQLITLILALFVLITNLLTDIAYVAFDPRIELSS